MVGEPADGKHADNDREHLDHLQHTVCRFCGIFALHTEFQKRFKAVGEELKTDITGVPKNCTSGFSVSSYWLDALCTRLLNVIELKSC